MVSKCYTLGIYSLTKKRASNPSCIITHHMHLVMACHWVTWDFVQTNTFHASTELKPSFTHLLTPRSTVLLEKLTGSQLVKKFPTFYGTRRSITAFTSARHLSLSWASSIQSTPPHPNSWRSILISSSHLHLGLQSGLFPSGFPTKTLYMPLLSPICTTQASLLNRKSVGLISPAHTPWTDQLSLTWLSFTNAYNALMLQVLLQMFPVTT